MEFSNISENTVRSKENSNVSIHFYLNKTKCKVIPDYVYIDVIKEINGSLSDECIIRLEAGTCILVGSSPSCQCTSTNNMLFLKRVNKSDEGVYIWKWRALGTTKKERRITLLVSGPDDGLTTDQLNSATTRFSTTKDTLTTHMNTTKETTSFQALYIAIPVVVSLVVAAIVITLWCCWRRKRQKISRTPGSEDKDSANKDQRDNLINKSKESEDLSSLPPSPSRAFTDWQTSKGQLTFLHEDQKQAPCAEVLSTPREKRDPQQTPQHSFQNVMELLKNFPQSDSPSINKQITKLTYRSGADGSVEIAFETNLSCPDKDQEKEDVSLGQHKMQQESPSDEDKEQAGLNACKTCIVEMELKSSIDVQEEQTATDIHRGFVDPNIKVIQHEDSMNLKQSGELKEPATQEDRLVKPSSPPEVVSPDSDLSANTSNFSEKPEETSTLLGKWSAVDQDSQSQTFETQVDPEILLSHLTTTTKLSEDNMEQQECSPVNDSASETGLLKVRTVQ